MHGGSNRTTKTSIVVPLVIIAVGSAIAGFLIFGGNTALTPWRLDLLSFSIMLLFALSVLFLVDLQRVGSEKSDVMKKLSEIEKRISSLEKKRTDCVQTSINEKDVFKPFIMLEQAPFQNQLEEIPESITATVQIPVGDSNPIIPSVPDNESSPIERFVELYNSGTRAESVRDDFYETYNPKRFANVDFSARAFGIETPPRYDLSDDGDFLAVLISGKPNDYWVVPRFAISLNSDLYIFGSMGEVFECLGYEPGKSYTALFLKKPAYFRKDGNGWTLVEQGTINVASDF